MLQGKNADRPSHQNEGDQVSNGCLVVVKTGHVA